LEWTFDTDLIIRRDPVAAPNLQPFTLVANHVDRATWQILNICDSVLGYGSRTVKVHIRILFMLVKNPVLKHFTILGKGGHICSQKAVYSTTPICTELL